jgi:15-cis-phytoene desaturase
MQQYLGSMEGAVLSGKQAAQVVAEDYSAIAPTKSLKEASFVQAS